jgi:hypothetical protein
MTSSSTDVCVKSRKKNIFCCHKAHDEMGALSRRKLPRGAPRLYRAKSKSTVWKYESFNLLEPSGPVQGFLYLLLLLPFVESGTEKQKGVNPCLYCRKHTIFLTPKCDVLLLNYSSSYSGTAFGLTNHIHKKKRVILTNPTFFRKYYKTGLNSPAASQVQKCSHRRLRQC